MLDIGHRGLIGGYFSHNKMADSWSQQITWPGIRKDIRAYCSACAECHRAGSLLKQKSANGANTHYISTLPKNCLGFSASSK